MKTQFNELIVVTVTPFRGTTTPDKNGLMPVMLQLDAGKMPNRNVLSGTVADNLGIEVGKTYLMRVREQGLDKVFGEAFTFTKISELGPIQALEAIERLSKPELLMVDKPEGFEQNYQRKGDAVESLTTQRIKQGQFIPANKRSYAHETASEIVEGSTVKDATKSQNLKEEDISGKQNEQFYEDKTKK